MEKQIQKAIDNLKENDEFFDDKSHELNRALELAKEARHILQKVNKMPERTYQLAELEFNYFDEKFKAQARFYLDNQEISDIKVTKKGDAWIERRGYSTKKREHLEDIAENQFKKLFQI